MIFNRRHLCFTLYSILCCFNLLVLSVSVPLVSIHPSLSGGKPLSSGCWPVSHPLHSLCPAEGCCGEAQGGKRSSCSCLSVFLPNSKYQQLEEADILFFFAYILNCDHSASKVTAVYLSDTKMLDDALKPVAPDTLSLLLQLDVQHHFHFYNLLLILPFSNGKWLNSVSQRSSLYEQKDLG